MHPAPRDAQLRAWVERQFPGAAFTLAPASSDASFRRYWRVQLAPAGGESFIVMDAPPAKEDCRPYVQVAELFGAAGVNVPKVFARDLAQGFLLLTDLGKRTYLEVLNDENADQLYRSAFDALVAMQRASRPDVLRPYDRELLLRELNLFPDWYIARYRERELTAAQTETLQRAFELILADNLAQPRVYVHRDYHSRNLMWSQPNPGILDFQDAVYGPVTYDAVSLLRDAYIEWPEARALDWLIRYWESARTAGVPVATDFAEFYRAYEWMGMQRHLKVLGIFARLYYRDGKDGYLKDLPLVMRYLRRACARYPELQPLAHLLEQLEGVTDEQVGYTF